MNRVAIVSLYDENLAEMGRVTARNKFDYCERHGYSFHSIAHNLTDALASYSKVPLIVSILGLHDWVVWIDADALIMNFNTRLETYLDDRFSLVIGSEWNGINAGVFFLKRCAWSFNFLRKTMSVPREGLQFFDQSQMAKVIAEDPEAGRHVKVIPLKQSGGEGDFNCYPTENRCFPRHESFQYFDHGDFIAHFVGSRYGGDEHFRFMTDLIKKYDEEAIGRERQDAPSSPPVKP